MQTSEATNENNENKLESVEGQEFKRSPTTWLIKCNQEQKEILQKSAAESGKSVAQFLVESVQKSALKEALSQASSETKKEFIEIGGLIERLNGLIYAKIYTLIEKEKMAEEVKTSFLQKENDCTKDYKELKEKLAKEYQEKKEKIEKEFKELLLKEKQNLQDEIRLKDEELLPLREKFEDLQDKIKGLLREKETLQKQYTESMRSYEIADERIFEYRAKIKELEERLKDSQSLKEKNSSLEKENFTLQVKMEAFEKEKALIREFLERDLRREYEMKYKDLDNGKNVS